MICLIWMVLQMNYSQLFKDKQHTITIRHRDKDYAEQRKNWNSKIFEKTLQNQDDNSDIYITKYPRNRMVECIILDFDSEDIAVAFQDVERLKNKLTLEGHNCVIVESGNKGYHLYIQISPVLFANAENEQRGIKDWNKFFSEFVHCLIFSTSLQEPHLELSTLDDVNTNAGLTGNIRLIGSKHPSSHKTCRIIEGSFKEMQEPTEKQHRALRYAHSKCEIVELNKKRRIKKLKIDGLSDPIQANDLREVLPQITGEEIKVYDRGYGYMKCPWHNDNKPSLLITKEWFSCSACGEKGNIWTLRKKGLVEFDENGRII